MRSKHAKSATVPGHTSRPALRHALRPPGMGIVQAHAAQSRQVGSFTAILHGQWDSVLDSARPPFERHAFGLGAQLRIGGAGGPAEAAEMGGCAVHANQGDEQAVIVGTNRDGKFLHGSTVAAH